MNGKARVSVLIVVALLLFGAAAERAGYLTAAKHFILRHEKMPNMAASSPLGFYMNPCGDGLDAMIAGREAEDGTVYLAYYLSDKPAVPWAVVVKRPDQSVAEAVILLDLDRDGYVDDQTTTDLDACTAQARVKKAGNIITRPRVTM